MKKRLLVLFVLGLLTNTEIFGQIFAENFDGTWNSPAPTGWASDRGANNARAWHRNDYTTYWASPAVGSPIASGAESTNYYARFHSSTVNSGITTFSPPSFKGGISIYFPFLMSSSAFLNDLLISAHVFSILTSVHP